MPFRVPVGFLAGPMVVDSPLCERLRGEGWLLCDGSRIDSDSELARVLQSDTLPTWPYEGQVLFVWPGYQGRGV